MRELLRERPNATMSAAGNAGGTTAVDSALSPDDDTYNDHYFLLCTSGTNSGENRPVSDYDGTGTRGTVTVSRAFTGQVASGVSYELLRYSPDDYMAAVNLAIWQLYRKLYRMVYNEEHSVGSILLNPSFETAIAAADWTASSAPTITYPTTTLMHGRAIQLVAGGSGVDIYQDFVDRLERIIGMGVTFGGLVRTTAASAARLQIGDGSSLFISHAYHSGQDGWEWQEIQTTVPTTAARVRVICDVAASQTAQFDAMYCIFHTPIRIRYDIGTTMINGPFALQVSRDKKYNPLYAGWQDWPFYTVDGIADPNSNNDSGPANSVGRYITLTQTPPVGHRLRMVGMAPLTAAAAESTAIEVDQPQVTRLAVRAAVILLEMQLTEFGGDEEIEKLLASLRVRDAMMDEERALWTPRPRVMTRNVLTKPW